MAKQKEEPTDLAPPDDDDLGFPDFVKMSDRPEGAEDMSPQDARVPRLSLAQSGSPQVDESDPQYIPGLKPGQVFNDLTGEMYGTAATPKENGSPIDVIFIRRDKPRHVEFAEDRSVIDPFVPPNDPRTQFTTEKGKRIPPIATKFYDYVVLMLPDLQPMAISFKGSGLKEAEKLNGLMITKAKGAEKYAPIYAYKYQLIPTFQENDKGKWYGFVIKRNGKVREQDLYTKAEAAFNIFKVKAVDFDQAPPREPGSDDDQM